MKTIWSQHIKDPNEKKQFESSVRHAKWLLDRQAEILNQMDKEFERTELSPKIYDLPNWEYRQAHANGYRQCLKQLQDLFLLDPKETNDRKPIASS